jgi:hypothetical protein
MIWYFAVGHQYVPVEWRVCTDSSKVSLKAVLLHSGNKFPCVMVAHAANIKKSYENINNFWKGSSMKNMAGISVET